MDSNDYFYGLAEAAKKASNTISSVTTVEKNNALLAIADELLTSTELLIVENNKDINKSKKDKQSEAFIDRLLLNEERITSMADKLRIMAGLPDPVGKIDDLKFMPSGIQVGRMRVPIGVIGMIYESRPNVTAEVSGLCIKSGNAVILKGGSEALNSNKAIHDCIKNGLRKSGLTDSVVQLISTYDRQVVKQLVTMTNYIDVIIPRGGKGLIEWVIENTRVPVIKHLDGICHVYIHRDADIDKARDIAINAKTHRYGVCNAMETLLIDIDIANEFLPEIYMLFKDKEVEVRGCKKCASLLPDIKLAADQDWQTEYLAPILSIKLVDNLECALHHIDTYGSKHTDAIVTENLSIAKRFINEVDSSSVIVNASTRFADGSQYGLGGEIGISADKIHVRGPVGLEGLTTQKYIVFGDGHIMN